MGSATEQPVPSVPMPHKMRTRSHESVVLIRPSQAGTDETRGGAVNTCGRLRAGLLALGLVVCPVAAPAGSDGHGPDAWRVSGVAGNDVLNVRMGPGTRYPVIDTFAHDARGLAQITCVPNYTVAHAQTMSAAERNNLPPRWCLMRSADLRQSGWVAQRYLVEDTTDGAVMTPTTGPDAVSGDDPVFHAQELVRALYEADDLARLGGPDPFDPAHASNYFSSDFVTALQLQHPGASLLHGGQDFEGSVSEPEADPDQPMLRGMITINVDFVNFGRPQRAVFSLRADPGQPGAPLRIFRVEHEGWSFP